MSADGETGTGATDPGASTTTPRRRRRRSASSSSEKIPARVERRADKVQKTIREVIRMRRRDLDDDAELSTIETVDRDAEQIGYAIASIGERILPFGRALDLLFGVGGPLTILVALAPTIRAARRDLMERRERRKRERATDEPPLVDGELPAPWRDEQQVA